MKHIIIIPLITIIIFGLLSCKDELTDDTVESYIKFKANGESIKCSTDSFAFSHYSTGNLWISLWSSYGESAECEKGSISIDIPFIVSSFGATYSQYSTDFDFDYSDGTNYWSSEDSSSYPFNFEIDRWEGPNGFMHGTFHGTLYDSSAPDIEITDGEIFGLVFYLTDK
ncbi:MAG: hypothetical protein GY754_18090 [bacterium]|nr:hypothetical protein [bacterium]